MYPGVRNWLIPGCNTKAMPNENDPVWYCVETPGTETKQEGNWILIVTVLLQFVMHMSAVLQQSFKKHTRDGATTTAPSRD